MQYEFDVTIDRTGTGSSKWLHAPKAVQAAQVMPFSVADMEFCVPPQIMQAVQRACVHGIYGYTMADEAYLSGLASWMQRRHGWEIQPEWVVTTFGVVPAINTAIRALTQPGDGVIIQPPVYPPFARSVQNNERVLLENPLQLVDGRYEMDFDGLAALCERPEAKLLLLCSPHNPVGRVWSEQELRRVGEICAQNGVVVVADEIHQDIAFAPHRHHVFATLGEAYRENCIVCTALSKTFNIAGLNCSNILIPNAQFRQAFNRQLEVESYHGLPYFAYAASLAGFAKCDAWLEEMKQAVQDNFAVLQAFFAEHFPSCKMVTPEGTYLAWIDCRGWGLSEDELMRFLEEEALWGVNRGSTFGAQGEGHIRFNLASPKHEIQAALLRLQKAAQARGLA